MLVNMFLHFFGISAESIEDYNTYARSILVQESSLHSSFLVDVLALGELDEA